MLALSDTFRDMIRVKCYIDNPILGCLINHYSTFHTAHSYVEDACKEIRAQRGDYLDFDGRMLSYLPATKTQLAFDAGHNPYTSSYRVSGRFGRMLRTIFGAWFDFTDAQIEEFGNKLRAAYEELKVSVYVVRGELIRHCYYERNYHSDASISSCMDGQYEQKYLDIYVENPNIGLAVITKPDYDGEDKVMARALVWNATNGTTYLDGVYGSQVYAIVMREYAKKRGWELVGNNNFDVSLDEWEFHYYPYIDNVSWLSPYRLSTSYGNWELTNTDGGRGEDTPTCAECGSEYLYEDSDYCESCWLAEFGTLCYDCDTRYHRNDMLREDGVWYCESCYNDAECTKCEEAVGYHNLEDGLCEECRKQPCDYCGEEQYEHELSYGLCGDCQKQSCDDCGQWGGELFAAEYAPMKRDWYESYSQYWCRQCTEQEHSEWLAQQPFAGGEPPRKLDTAAPRVYYIHVGQTYDGGITYGTVRNVEGSLQRESQ